MPGGLLQIQQATNIKAVTEPPQAVSPVRVHTARMLRTHNIVDRMNILRPACTQVDQVVAMVVPPAKDGYETGDSNESIALEAAIDDLVVAFSYFLRIANQCQHRHGQGNAGTGVQATMNIIHDLQFD